MTRPPLDPVTLRWLAEEETRAAKSYEKSICGCFADEACAYCDGAARIARVLRLRAKRLRNLATREARKRG